MIRELSVTELFKSIIRQSFSIDDAANETSVIVNIYDGAVTESPSDYYTCMWGVHSAIPSFAGTLLNETIDIHSSFRRKAEFPKERLVFDLSWCDKGQESTELQEIVDAPVEKVSQQIPNLVNSRFVRLDGQFFSLVIDDLNSRPVPVGVGKHARSTVGISSIFNISSSLTRLYTMSMVQQPPSVSQTPGYRSLSEDIEKVIGRFPDWSRINTVGGQLDPRS